MNMTALTPGAGMVSEYTFAKKDTIQSQLNNSVPG